MLFDSDDWGAAHLKDSATRQQLVRKGLDLDSSSYHRFDTLESRNDLEGLFEILSRYRDKDGNHPIFTFNTVMSNPHYEKIKKDEI